MEDFNLTELIRDDYMTVLEVSQRLRVSKSFVYAAIQTGELPAVRLGRAVRIPSQALAAYILQRAGIEQ